MENGEKINDFERLFHQYQPVLVTYAYHFVKSREDAREVVQDVFLGVWNNRQNLKFNSELKAYLFTATRNKCLNFLQKKKLLTVSINQLNIDSDSGIDIEAEIAAAELKTKIFTQIQQLPIKCKEIFLLSRQEGLSYKEIAKRQDVSEKTVENQIGIALKKIRQGLYGNGPSLDEKS